MYNQIVYNIEDLADIKVKSIKIHWVALEKTMEVSCEENHYKNVYSNCNTAFCNRLLL